SGSRQSAAGSRGVASSRRPIAYGRLPIELRAIVARAGDQGADMADTYNGRKRIRKQFGSIPEVAEMPNLIEVQKSSYDDFLMVKEPPGGRGDQGLQAVFKSVFPISD